MSTAPKKTLTKQDVQRLWDAQRYKHTAGVFGDRDCFFALLEQGVDRQALVRAGLAGPWFA
jgi:hypothetical protein